MAAKFPPPPTRHYRPSTDHNSLSPSPYIPRLNSITELRIPPKTIPWRTLRCSKRTGKRKYPSEKKKIERMINSGTPAEIKRKDVGFWRFSSLTVSVHIDPGKDFFGISPPLIESISKILKFPVAAMLPMEAFEVVRKSFDARKLLKEPQFVYTVDMDVDKLLNLEPRTRDFVFRLERKLGTLEYMPLKKSLPDLITILHNFTNNKDNSKHQDLRDDIHIKSFKQPKVAVVGCGPSGLFASLVLSELGADVTLIERGQAVEKRGRDIGALVVRRALQPESNFCFGEGGAGTWSDGKLITRIGKNRDNVQAVMKTLVQFGAPPEILLNGKPHLGTDRLVGILQNFRRHLVDLGVDIKFGTRLDDLIIENKRIIGIKVSDTQNELRCDGQNLFYDAVVLAVGHSARDVYQMLLQHDVDIVPKDFSVGLRIEHPQEVMNNIQYSSLAAEVHSGRGKVPVADYKLANFVSEDDITKSCPEDRSRNCYSFCMCPGGQVVLTSTNSSELCINGMSFSRRSSRWANAAIVVTVSTEDFAPFRSHGPLRGVEFQRLYERKAAIIGGGNFVVPAQTVTDFLDNKLTVTSLPRSSYRLGVKPSKLHELFPTHITKALQQSISAFDKEIPGFICKDALLHGVETRTSAPIQILRSSNTFESTSLSGLYPAGEGAGYAGGIISAAVDGVYSGISVAKNLGLFAGDIESILGKAQTNTGFVKY